MRKPEKCMEGKKADRILLIEKPGEPTREAAWEGFCGDGTCLLGAVKQDTKGLVGG